jgi:hypothetical protein
LWQDGPIEEASMSISRTATAVALAVGLAAAAAADTLVLRSGQRIEGTLVGVRGDTIEFESSGSRRRVDRYDRDDVRRIEFDSGGFGGGSGSSGRPSGLRERSVSVSAREGWNDTGIDVRRGQEVYFSASGRPRWGRDRADGPAGERGSPRNPNRPIPDRPGGALIGRIGNGDPFLVGDDRGPIRVRDSGRLFLGINDDYLLDNSGEFRVTIYY